MMRQLLRAGRLGALAMIVICSSFQIAASSDYFPLRPGDHWEYIQTNAPVPHLFVDVIGPAEFHAASTIAVTWTVSGYGESTTSTLYYSEAPGGVILYHGAGSLNSLGVYGESVLTPPKVLLQPPLTEGATWSGSFTESIYQDGEFAFSREVEYTALVSLADHVLSLPAGELAASKVTTTSTFDGAESFWYTEGVGMVRWERGPTSTPEGTYNLFGHSFSVPMGAESMSGLKAHFMND